MFITPGQYVFRMFYRHGAPLEDLGVPCRSDTTEVRPVAPDARKIWPDLRGTPTRTYQRQPARVKFAQRLPSRVVSSTLHCALPPVKLTVG